MRRAWVVLQLLNTMGTERGSLWLFAFLLLPGVILNPSVFVALAFFQAASAIARGVFMGDNRATA